MTSEKKSAAARANGAKSRGPKSDETRAKSSRNSLRHGLTSQKTILLKCENPDEFQEMLDEYMAVHQPATPAEKDFVDEMVAARWRIQRFWTIETVLLDSEMDNQQTLDEDNPAVQLAAAFRSLADNSRALSLLSRYESRLHRIYDRAYQRLRELQQARQSLTAQPKPAEPPPGQELRNEPTKSGKLLEFPAVMDRQPNRKTLDPVDPRASAANSPRWSG